MNGMDQWQQEENERLKQPPHPESMAAMQDEISILRAQLASARKALQFIADGYENHDINHVDYRVNVYQVATETLEEIA